MTEGLCYENTGFSPIPAKESRNRKGHACRGHYPPTMARKSFPCILVRQHFLKEFTTPAPSLALPAWEPKETVVGGRSRGKREMSDMRGKIHRATCHYHFIAQHK